VLSVLLGLAGGLLASIDVGQLAQLDAFGGVIVLGLLGIAAVLLSGWVRRRAREGHASVRPSNATIAVLMQAVVALAILAVTVAIPWPASLPGWAVLALCVVIAGVLGAGLGSEAFGLSILWAGPGQVAEWQMSGQAVEDYNGFLRLHIASQGDLTIYPLAIDRICRDWELVDDPAGGKRPVPASPLPAPRLIENPVIVSRQGSAL
jgi:hypothetical protein